MTTIMTLPACAALPAARQLDTTLDPASGDPFAAALAAALTAGLIVAQPAPAALVTLGTTAQPGVSSDDGAAATDTSFAAGSQTAATAAASSAPSTPRTLLPIAAIRARLGDGPVASLAPPAAADGALTPAERGPLPSQQPTAKPDETAPDSSGLAASPVSAPRQRPAAAPPASSAGAAGHAPDPTSEPAGDGEMIAVWPGRDAVTVERVVRGAAPSVSASRVAAPPAATRDAPAPSAGPSGDNDDDVTAAWPGRDAVTAERVVRGAAGRAQAPVASSQASETAVASSPPSAPRTPAPVAGSVASLAQADAPAPSAEPAGDNDDVTAAWPAPDAVTVERVVRGAAGRAQAPVASSQASETTVASSPLSAPRTPAPVAGSVAAPPAATRDVPAPSAEPAGDGDVTTAWPGRDAVTAERVLRGAAPSVSANRVAAPPAATRDLPAPSAEPAGDGDVTTAWPGRDAVTAERVVRGAAPSVSANRVAAPPAATRDVPAPSTEPAGDGDVTAARPGRDAVTAERVVRGAAPSVSANRVAAPPAATRDVPAPSAEPAGDGDVTTAWPGRDAVTAGRVVRGAAPSVSANRVAAPPAATRDAPAIEQPAPSSNEGLDALISHAVRRLAAPVAAVGQPKRGEAEEAAALSSRWTPATEGKTQVPSAVPAAAELAQSDTLRVGSESSREGTQTWVGAASLPGRDAVTVERVLRGAAPSLRLSVNASRVAAPPAATLDAPAIEQPAPSSNGEPDALTGFAARRLAARVAGVGQLKRGGTQGAAVPAAAEMAEGDTLSAGSGASLEGTQEWVGDDGARMPLRLIKFPTMRSRLGRRMSPAPADASGAGEDGAPASGRPSPIRRTTRSGELRVEAPRSAMTPAPSAPAPAVAMSVPAAPALSGTASLAEPAPPLALVAPEPVAPPPAPTDRVTLRIGGEDGDATRVWVSVRGDTVHTRIATADAPAAAALTSALGELQSALERQGFTDASVRVLVPSPGPNDGRAAPPAAQTAVNVAAAITPSRGTDAPSDGNLPGKQRGQDTATDRPGQHGQRPHQRSPRERER